MKRPALHIHTTHARDAALQRLRHVNRWLIFGSILLTGVLADVAANAFPGHKKTAASKAAGRPHRKADPPTGVLAPPEQSPERAPQGPSEGAEANDPPSEGSAGEAPPAEATAPSETQAPEAAPEAESSTQEPSEPSGPVVSGGS